MLRLLTCLAPSIPAGFFRLVARLIATETRTPVELRYETRISGPLPGDPNPFAEGSADVGFICGPSFDWQRDALELLPVPVPTDPRAAGRPVYFCDVVVPRESAAASFDDLRGRRWAVNDRNSRSGWFCAVDRLAPADPAAYFGAIVDAGSHLASLRLLLTGRADAAAIDSNALRHAAARDGRLRHDLRILETLGPYPIQPVVIRAAVAPRWRAGIRAALLRAHATAGDALHRYGFAGFVDPAAADYGLTDRRCERIAA